MFRRHMRVRPVCYLPTKIMFLTESKTNSTTSSCRATIHHTGPSLIPDLPVHTIMFLSCPQQQPFRPTRAQMMLAMKVHRELLVPSQARRQPQMDLIHRPNHQVQGHEQSSKCLRFQHCLLLMTRKTSRHRLSNGPSRRPACSARCRRRPCWRMERRRRGRPQGPNLRNDKRWRRGLKTRRTVLLRRRHHHHHPRCQL